MLVCWVGRVDVEGICDERIYYDAANFKSQLGVNGD